MFISTIFKRKPQSGRICTEDQLGGTIESAPQYDHCNHQPRLCGLILNECKQTAFAKKNLLNLNETYSTL